MQHDGFDDRSFVSREMDQEQSGSPVSFPSERGAAAARDGIYRQRFAIEFDYPVCFTNDLFAPSNPLFADTLSGREGGRRHRFIVLVDDGLAKAWATLPSRIADYAASHAEVLDLVAVPEFIPGGERCKSDPALVERLQRRLVEAGMDRHAFVVAIGGGAVLDLVGYAAATVHRGIRLVRVPTTVLAQNDSGVGVKNGVNGFGLKNLLGTFVPPFAVLNDSRFLDALDPREKSAGMAEAVKVALIRDSVFFEWIEANAPALGAYRPEALAHLIRRCAELHMIQIATGGDPFERGSARPLDYGHWSAHKLETLTGHALRHGEAVAIGIALDARYSVLAGLLPAGEDERICAVIRRLGLPLWDAALDMRGASGELAVLRGLHEFREHLGGELTITLLAGIGHGVEVHAMNDAWILDAIAWLKREASA